jgi:hypothetical protein
MKDMPKEQENTQPNEETPQRAAPGTRVQSGGTAAEGWLLGAGTTMLLTGTAMLLVPTISPQYSWIVRSLATRGLTSVPLSAVGVLLCGLWLVVRTSRSHSIAAQEAAKASGPVLDKMAEEIAHLGDGLQGLRIELVYLKDAVQTQADLARSGSAGDSPADGMYRLAASLDQLGARVEERLNASHREICDKLHDLSTGIQSSQVRAVEELSANVVESQSFQLMDPDQAVEGAGFDTTGQRERLGLLDLLDDLGRLLPRKASPDFNRPAISAGAFEGARDEGWDHHASLGAPLPAVRSGDEIHLASAGELLGRGLRPSSDESSVVKKLEELRSLLADDRVREALTAIGRERE